MTPYVIYARKSTESEDRQIMSIESQVREMQQLAARTGVAIVDVLTESKSAKRPGRPIFGELKRRVERGSVRGVLAWKMDRLARNHLDHGWILQALADGLLERIITSDRPYTSDGNDRFIGNFELGMATKYSDDLSQNVRRGIRSRLERGWFSAKPPLGYLIEPTTKEIIKDPERFDQVRRLWDLLLTGTMRPELIRSIANHDLHLRTHNTKRRPGQTLSRTTLYNIFGNLRYTGLIPHRSGRIYVGAHPAMITKVEFDRAQEILGRSGRPRPQVHGFAFTGFFTCGGCGGAVTAEEHVKPSGRHYVYYHCSRRRAGRPCREPAISEPELVNQVTALLGRLRMPEAVHAWLCREAMDSAAGERDQRAEVLATYEKAIEGLGREHENLLTLRLRDLIDDEAFGRRERDIADRRRALEARVASAKAGRTSTDSLIQLFTFAARAQATFASGTVVQQRMILEALGSNRTLTRRTVALSLDKPLDLMAQASSLSNWSGCLDDVRTWLRNGATLSPGISAFAPASDGSANDRPKVLLPPCVG
jgi:site-specific DNA recombinase